MQNNKPIAWQDMQQDIDYHTVKLQQHRERVPDRSIQHITLPALPVGVAIYCQVRSQTTQNDRAEATARNTPRLQQMLTQIQGYDFKFMYKPGPELVLADTPSRFPNVYTGSKSGQCHDRQHRDGLATCRSSKTTSVEGGNDPRYRTDSTWPIIYTGWPDKLQDLPGEIRDYWSY